MDSALIMCISIEGENFCNAGFGIKIDGVYFKSLPSLKSINDEGGGIFVRFLPEFDDVERFQGKRIFIFYYSKNYGKVNAKKMLICGIIKNSNGIVLECVGLDFLLSFGRANMFSLTCRANFGDAKCKADLSRFTINGKAERYEHKKREIYNSSLVVKNSEVYKNGKITIKNNTFIVLSAQDGFIKILNDKGIKIESGEEYVLTAGCDKTLKTCKEVHKNVVNFQGEPFVFEKFSSSIF